MSKHTPGPWLLSGPYAPHGSQFNVLYVDGTTDGAVASVHMHHERGQANARLISAAPDLLAALEECTELMETIHKSAISRARAAIAKSRGEAWQT